MHRSMWIWTTTLDTMLRSCWTRFSGENHFVNEIIWKRATAHSDAEFTAATLTAFISTRNLRPDYILTHGLSAYDDAYVARTAGLTPMVAAGTANLTAKTPGGGYDFSIKAIARFGECRLGSHGALEP